MSFVTEIVLDLRRNIEKAKDKNEDLQQCVLRTEADENSERRSWNRKFYEQCIKDQEHYIAKEEYLLEAVKAYEPWRSPVEPPEKFAPVIICREDKEGNRRVEAGSLQEDGWYKIYGTRTKKILGWMPMPEAMKDA